MKTVEWNPEFGTGGVIHCTCDNCGKGKDYKFSKKPNFKAAHEKLLKLGWMARKLGDTWYNFCSDECFENFRG